MVQLANILTICADWLTCPIARSASENKQYDRVGQMHDSFCRTVIRRRVVIDRDASPYVAYNWY